MLYKRKGMPEEGELVVVTVTKIHHHSVFAKLMEYPGKVGLLHISEIAPGRIRNIYDYVKEGKVIVCKILRVDERRGHIDLSLRRVSDSQRIKKMSLLKQEQKAEKIIENVAQELDVPFKDFYKKIASVVFKEYDFIYDYFFDIIMERNEIGYLDLPAKEAEVLETFVRQRIKRPQVEVKGKLRLISHASDGVDRIRSVLVSMEKVDEKFSVTYLGAGVYSLYVTSENFKEAEDILSQALKIAQQGEKEQGIQFHFEREEGKSIA